VEEDDGTSGVAMRNRLAIPAALFLLTLTLTVACRTPTTPPLDNILDHYKYGILGTEGTRGGAVLDLSSTADCLRRQAAEPSGERLGEDRVSL
jgi:hypothetical protein